MYFLKIKWIFLSNGSVKKNYQGAGRKHPKLSKTAILLLVKELLL